MFYRRFCDTAFISISPVVDALSFDLRRCRYHLMAGRLRCRSSAISALFFPAASIFKTLASLAVRTILLLIESSIRLGLVAVDKVGESQALQNYTKV